MHKDIEHKVKDISEMKETLTCWVKMEIAKGAPCCNTEELGEVIDMIKDLAEAEKSCYEACYYKSVTKAMEEYDEEEDEEGRMGYNSRRYASGRYAPAGRGHMGYRVGNWPYMDSLDDNMRMGYRENYNGDSSSSSSGNNRSGYIEGEDPRYGRAYNEYKNARRHYTSTNSQADKDEMNRHADEHVMDTLASLRDIYKSAEPEQKKRMKADLTKLVAEMPT